MKMLYRYVFSFFAGMVIFRITSVLYFFTERRSKSLASTVPLILTTAPEKEIFDNPPVKPIRPIIDGSKQWVQLVSAYYDDRAGLGEYACVRVILIRDIKVTPSQCLLLNANHQLLLAKKTWLQKIGLGMKHKSSFFSEEISSCCVSRSMRPAHVALIYSNEKPSQETLTRLGSGDILKVQYPPKPNGAPRTIINCVSATFGSPDPKRVVEWLELQRLLGMDKVEIHDVNMSPATRRIFEAYSEDGFVEVLDLSPVLFPDHYNLLHMSPAINNCLFRNMHMYKAIAVFDLDEVIVPRYHDTYGEMVTYLRNFSVNEKRPHPHFLFFNFYFYMNINVSRPKAKEWTSTFTRYLHHTRVSPPYHVVKSIVDPASCFAMHNHYCWADVHHEPEPKSSEPTKEPILEHVKVQIGANHHYKLCIGCGTNLNDFYEERTMCKYRRRLDQRILQKFKTFGLIY